MTEGALEIGKIGAALVGEFCVEIIFLLGQAEPAGEHPQRVHRRIVGVGIGAGTEQRAAELAIGRAHVACESALVRQRIDLCQIAHQRRETRALDRRLVHKAGVERAILRACGGLSDQPVDLFGHILAQIVERADRGAIAGNFGPVDPRARGIAFEIVTRIGGGVARGEVEPEVADLGLAGDDDGVGVGFLGEGRRGESQPQRERGSCRRAGEMSSGWHV